MGCLTPTVLLALMLLLLLQQQQVAEANSFTLSSTAFDDGDTYPDAFMCKADDGGVNPPLKWKNAPSGRGTLTVDPHPDVDYDRYDWVLYDIDASVSQVEEGKDSAVGTLGGTTPGLDYAYRPTCPSSGSTYGTSGTKTLTFTVHGAPCLCVCLPLYYAPLIAPSTHFHCPQQVYALGGDLAKKVQKDLTCEASIPHDETDGLHCDVGTFITYYAGAPAPQDPCS
jgi:phosphatidylethanolamine-binding protein (PEBP) family uncharacterized protein